MTETGSLRVNSAVVERDGGRSKTIERAPTALLVKVSRHSDGAQMAEIERHSMRRLREAIELDQSLCALDVADEERVTLEDIATMVCLSRERVRQIEVAALRKIREAEPGTPDLSAWAR